MGWFGRAARTAFGCFSVFMFISALRSDNLNVGALPPKSVLVLSCVLVIVFIIAITPLRHPVLRRLAVIKNFAAKRIWPLTLLFIVLTLGYQLFLIVFLRVDPGFDPTGLLYIEGATFHGEAITHPWLFDYLSLYPNNHFIFFFFHSFSGITGGPRLAVWMLLNMLFIDLGVLLTALAARKRFGNRVGYCALYMGMIILCLQPYVLIPYTDTMVLPFVATGLLLIAYYDPQWSTIKHVGMGFVLGLVIGCSYLMKPSSIIVFLALAIVGTIWFLPFFFSGKRQDINQSAVLLRSKESLMPRKPSKRLLLKIPILFLVAILFFTGTNQAFRMYVEEQTYYEIDSSKQFPLTHFFMMGLPKLVNGQPNYTGGWDESDVLETWEAGDYDEKVAFTLERIQERLEYFGLSGYLVFLPQKFYANTSDGSFFYRGEGPSATFASLNPDNVFTETLGRFYLYDGDYFRFFRFYDQLLWVALLFFLLCSVRSKDSYALILKIAIIGGLVFLLLFEGGRSRYLVQYLPCFIILASLGLLNFCRLSKKTL